MGSSQPATATGPVESNSSKTIRVKLVVHTDMIR